MVAKQKVPRSPIRDEHGARGNAESPHGRLLAFRSIEGKPSKRKMIRKSTIKVESFFSSLMLVYSLALAQGVECPPGCSSGRWSTEAVDLSSESVKAPEQSRDIRIYSPDGKKVIRVVQAKWWVEMGPKKIKLSPKISHITYPAELGWAADGSAFYITQSFGYETGYHTDVYRLKGDGITRFSDVNRTIQRDFERRHKCEGSGMGNVPNIAGLLWMDGSKQLLMVAEVPPVGICTQMEYFGGYSVSISTGQIIERYNPQELMQRWDKVLGERLKGNFNYLSSEERVMKP